MYTLWVQVNFTIRLPGLEGIYLASLFFSFPGTAGRVGMLEHGEKRGVGPIVPMDYQQGRNEFPNF